MYYLCSVNRPKAFEQRSVLLYLQVHFQALGNEVKYLLPFALGGLVEGVEAAEVLVYNSIGQLVKTLQNSNEINVAGLPQGVYLLRIRDEEGKVFTAKLAVK